MWESIWYLSALSSEDTKDFLPKPGIENSFHKMLIMVRYGMCDFEDLQLMKDWKSEGVCEGQNGC